MMSYNVTTGSGRANLWEDWTNLFLGIWLFVSPWVFQLPNDSGVAWNAWISGGIIAVIAAAALLYQVQKWEEWTNAIVGIWIASSPWALGFSQTCRRSRQLVSISPSRFFRSTALMRKVYPQHSPFNDQTRRTK
jgi:hypothetical protein